jgi:hypothetical protein
LARAVTASSAVSVLFEPVVVKNYQECNKAKPDWLLAAEKRAAGDPEPEMDVSNRQPSLGETINAMSDVQLHRYNAATLELMDASLKRWAKDLSAPGSPVTPGRRVSRLARCPAD